jgi:hypothetical protein
MRKWSDSLDRSTWREFLRFGTLLSSRAIPLKFHYTNFLNSSFFILYKNPFWSFLLKCRQSRRAILFIAFWEMVGKNGRITLECGLVVFLWDLKNHGSGHPHTTLIRERSTRKEGFLCIFITEIFRGMNNVQENVKGFFSLGGCDEILVETLLTTGLIVWCCG